MSKNRLAEIIFPLLRSKKTLDFGIKILEYFPKTVNFPLALVGLFSCAETAVAAGDCKILKLSRNQMKHFLDMINKDLPPICSLADGIQAQKLAMAVLKAAEENIVIKKEEL